MTREKQLELIKQLDASLIDVLISKGNDYATEDVLSNFKRLGAAAKSLNMKIDSAYGYAAFMVLMKLDRINNLVTSGKTPSNESVEDSFGDLINYAKLCYCICKENNVGLTGTSFVVE